MNFKESKIKKKCASFIEYRVYLFMPNIIKFKHLDTSKSFWYERWFFERLTRKTRVELNTLTSVYNLITGFHWIMTKFKQFFFNVIKMPDCFCTFHWCLIWLTAFEMHLKYFRLYFQWAVQYKRSPYCFTTRNLKFISF